MTYPGLNQVELDEIQRLNVLYLMALQHAGGPLEPLRPMLGEASLAWLRRCSTASVELLAAVPYLLFRVDTLTPHRAAPRNRDMFLSKDPEAFELLTLALAFVHQLARRDRFALRVITGASEAWCGWLQDVSFVRLAESARQSDVLLLPILVNHREFWPGLITSVRKNLLAQRDAIVATGLQHLLNTQTRASSQRLAARSIASASLQVADGPARF